MNELQIRLSADITALTTALKRAEKSIKEFEESTSKETQKSNLGFQRKKGIIEELTIKAKNLRTALNQATSVEKIAKYNAQLEETSRELTRLNALGRSVSANLGSTAGGFGQVARQGAKANSVALEFNRIIQDAPFGLIGIGNNLQQLAGNFSQVSKQAGGAGKAISASLASIVSPVNLGLLAISALTAGFTAYQMGAFDWIFANKKVEKSFEDLVDEIDNAASRSAAELASVSALRGVIEDETLSRDSRLKAIERLQDEYPKIFENANKEKLLNGQLIQSYDLLTKAIIQRSEASVAEERIPELNKEKQVVDNQIKALQRKLALEEAILKTTSKTPSASGLSVVTGSTAGTGQGFDAFAAQEAKVSSLNKEIEALNVRSKGLDINIQGFANSISSYYEEFIDLLEPVDNDFKKTAKDVDGLIDYTKLLSEILSDTKKKFENLDFASVLKKELSVLQGALSQAVELGSSDEITGLQSKIDNVKQILKSFSNEIQEVPIQIDFKPEVVKQQKGAIQELEQLISNYKTIVDTSFDPEVISAYNLKIQETQEALQILNEVGTQEMTSFTEILGESFMSLGNQIGMATGLAKTGWEGFARIILTNAPKIIGAIIAQAKAQKVAANIANQANVSEATGNAVVAATQTAKSLGPYAAIALPILIAGAVALVSGAFSKIGGGASVPSGGGGSVGAPPQIFTNAPQSFSPNTGNVGSGSSSFNPSLKAEIGYDSLTFYLDQYKEGKSRS